MSKTFKEKEVVWAKMRGHPHWPAKIMRPPRGVKPPAHKLFVYFFGTHEHAWIPEGELFPYVEFCNKFKKPLSRKGFMEAISEAEDLLPKIERTLLKKTDQQHPSSSHMNSTSGATNKSTATGTGPSSTTPANPTGSSSTTHAKDSTGQEESVMDTFFSQESRDSAQEMPIPVRKRKALRSLSHEPVKRTRKSDSGSVPPCDPSPTVASPGRNPTMRLTRSVTPQYYQTHSQPASSSITEPNSSQPTILDYVTTPVIPTQPEGGTYASSGNEIEARASEQVRISNIAVGETSSHQTSLPKLEGDVTSVESEPQKGESVDDRSDSEFQQTSSSQVSVEVVSPRRYSTRRQDRSQGSIVERLTQSYSARIEQALGSPEVKKKPLQSPKRTPKAPKPTTVAPKSAHGRGRRSRGDSKSKAIGGERGGVSQLESAGDEVEEANLSQPSMSMTSTGGKGEPADEKQANKDEKKSEPGRRKSARLSKLQTTSSTPDKREASGKRQKESAGTHSTRKKRNRQTSESSVEEQGGEAKEAAMTTKEEPVTNVEESIRASQSDTGEVVFAPVNKKSSRVSKSGATAIPEDEATPVEDESEAPHSAKQRTRGGSSARVLRSRQRGKPGPKAKSQPKRIKLEDSTEPGVADSQEAGSVTEQSEGKKKESKEKESVSEESMPEEKSTDDTSDNKRVLRKRKQTDYGGGGNNSKRAADACKSTEDAVEEISDSTKTPKSEPEDESSKIDTEVAQDTERADGSVEKADEKGEQLIVRVSTSSVTTNSECEGTEKESLSRREDDKKTNNLGPNEGEPPSLTESTSTTAVDDEGQSSSGGGEVAPPPSSDQLSHDPSTSNGGQPSEGDKVEPPKITDRSQLPSMVQIRTGMSADEVLRAYNYNIKASLVTTAPDVSKALATLRDLKEFQFSATDLEKVPDLVHTIRKLKHYRASSKVMQRAEELYGKLKGLYMHPKLVVRPPKKKTAGGAGIRKRPPTMPELLNNQPRQQSRQSKSKTPSKPKQSTSSTSATSSLEISQTPPPSESGGIDDVITKRPNSAQIGVANAQVVPQMPKPNATLSKDEKVSEEDKVQPDQQLAGVTGETANTSTSNSLATVPTSSSTSTTCSVPSENSLSCSTVNSSLACSSAIASSDLIAGSVPPLSLTEAEQTDTPEAGIAPESAGFSVTKADESSNPLKAGSNSNPLSNDTTGTEAIMPNNASTGSCTSTDVQAPRTETDTCRSLETDGHSLTDVTITDAQCGTLPIETSPPRAAITNTQSIAALEEGITASTEITAAETTCSLTEPTGAQQSHTPLETDGTTEVTVTTAQPTVPLDLEASVGTSTLEPSVSTIPQSTPNLQSGGHTSTEVSTCTMEDPPSATPLEVGDHTSTFETTDEQIGISAQQAASQSSVASRVDCPVIETSETSRVNQVQASDQTVPPSRD